LDVGASVAHSCGTCREKDRRVIKGCVMPIWLASVVCQKPGRTG
jgi:hypothetical protein